MKNGISLVKPFMIALLTVVFVTATGYKTTAQNSYFINKTATPSTVQSGQTVTYTIGYSTAAAVNNLVITETVPPGFTRPGAVAMANLPPSGSLLSE